MNKRRIYIGLFTVLGILLGFLLHGGLEIWYTNLLITDFDRHSLGHSWETWFAIHKYGAIGLFVLSAIWGYFQGRFWWRVVYVEKRFDPLFSKLRKLFGIKPYEDHS